MRPASAALCLLALLGCAHRGGIKVIKASPRPAAPAPEAVVAAPQSVLVRAGDSFWRIAARELGDGSRYAELAELNGLTAQSLIKAGQTLKLPAGNPSSAPTASGRSGPGVPKKQARAERFPKRPNAAYTVGEKLTFAVQYFNMTGGYATLAITEYSTQLGRVCMHVQADAKTIPAFELFFTVKDRIETFIDAEALVPWRYEKHIHEGGYKADAMYYYDHRKNLMIEPAKNKQITIPADCQDVLSCFYWFRTMDMSVGRSEYIHVAADDMKNYDLKVDVIKKERVSTLAGDFDCILVQPHLKFEGVFQQKGDVFIWITDDARRIPVMIKSKIAIGSININLQDAEWVQP